MSSSKDVYVPVYAATLLLSAFLLFLVQPLFGKMILPLLGGSPSVWNTAMLFFQALLLAGYAYAHGTARWLSIRVQAALHLVLLVVFLFVLPIAIPDGWIPPAGKDPTLWQLSLMTIAVGGPFFILSGSAPMLQHWFAHTKHKDADNPYFLYAASNLGSMTALIAYPFLVEPAFGIDVQSLGWSYGYGLLIVFVLLAAVLAFRHAAPGRSIVKEAGDTEIITNQRRLLWLLLAFVPSSLMLGVTTFITTDLASVPLLWIVPLALYVSTFIIAFAKKPLIGMKGTFLIQSLLLAFVLGMLGALSWMKIIMIMGNLALFFFSALMCHHELSYLRPKPRHLTQFYLIMSLGGALGGFFNAIIAPNVFVLPLEYGIILALVCFMRGITDPAKAFAPAWAGFKDALKRKDFFHTGIPYVAVALAASIGVAYLKDFSLLHLLALMTFIMVLTMTIEKRWTFALCALAILAVHPPGSFWGNALFDDIHYRDRNFFGVVRVADSEEAGVRSLLHGTTIHGTQPLDPAQKMVRLSYYSENSGISDALALGFNGAQKIGVLGLGIGVIACYQKDGRSFDFFEIDPAVTEVAENPELFTYLSDCGSPYEIVMGDGRLTIGDKPDGTYDIIVMDAFSSDSIPIHLLTLDAFQLYKKKLAPDGFIVINVSNRYLNLTPVIASNAKELGMQAFIKRSKGGKIGTMPFYDAEFMAMTDNPRVIDHLTSREWKIVEPEPGFRLWTDQYSNITALFKMFHKPAAETVAKEKAAP